MPNDWTRHNDPDRRLRELREKGVRNSKHKLLIVHRVTDSIKEDFGGQFMVLTEGAGLYSHKFSRVYTTLTPNTDKYGAWWAELQWRCDTGRIEFL